MKPRRFVIGSWWTSEIREWFEDQHERLRASRLTKDETSPASSTLQRLGRLAADTRMKAVAKRLLEEEKKAAGRGEKATARWFIQDAWNAPDVWVAIKHQHGRVRYIRQILRHSQRLRASIDRDRDAVRALLRWFGNSPEASAPPIEDFLALLRLVENAITRGTESLPMEGTWAVPRKVGAKNVLRVFCANYLGGQALTNYLDPLHKEVAVTVSVLLDLTNEIDPKELRKRWTARRDRAVEG